VRHYHQRTRDGGEKIVWYQDGAELGAVTPWDRAVSTEEIAFEVLRGVVGVKAAERLWEEFVPALASWGASWDATADEIREWAAGRPGA
jgi:hypothetical protein